MTCHCVGIGECLCGAGPYCLHCGYCNNCGGYKSESSGRTVTCSVCSQPFKVPIKRGRPKTVCDSCSSNVVKL